MSAIFTMLKEKRLAYKALCDQTGALLTKAHTEKREKPGMTKEENAEFDKRMAEADAMKVEIGQLDQQLQAERETLGVVTDTRSAGRENVSEANGTTNMKPERRKEVEALCFRAWIAGGPQRLTGETRSLYISMQQELAADPNPEVRALSDVTGASGAYTVPQGFVYDLNQALKYFGGMIDAADYIDTESGNLLPWPQIDDTGNTGEVISENTQVAGTTGGSSEQDPTYSVVNYNAYMHDSGFVRVPVQLMDDTAFPMESYLINNLKIRIGRKLNNLTTVGAGSGSSQPLGITNAAALGYTGASPTTISYNEILSTLHSVDPAYRVGPKVGWMFCDSTLLALRKLVDSNNRPLFLAGGITQGIDQPQPDTLAGYQYWINQDMPMLSNSNKSVLFGDFSKYKIRRVKQMQMVRANERFIDQLQIGFLCWQRYDGNLLNAGNPIRYFQNSAT